MDHIKTRQYTNHAALHSDDLIARIFAARGITDAKELDLNLQQLLPYQHLKNISAAVELLAQHIFAQHNILIIGDYDADGATASALAVSALKSLGAQNVQFFVPNRFEYGYGLTAELVEAALPFAPKLIITVDNGISSFEGCAAARALNIDVLVTDHHLAPENGLPDANVIVNPNQPGCQFASKHLCGVGVIFYVMLALRAHLRNCAWFEKNNLSEPNMAQFLDLVALGTIADVVSLDQNNRILVQQGLNRIRAGAARTGIKALLQIAGKNPAYLSSSDLAFAIAPRLNAAGRLEDMSIGVQCLLSTDEVAALQDATRLNQLNVERKSIEADMLWQALDSITEKLNQQSMPAGLCLYEKTWHQGVIGIIAGRLKEKYYRPTLIFAESQEGELKASGRSIMGIHLRDLLADIAARHPHLIKKFGGHAMAAGLSIAKKDFAQFKQVFENACLAHAQIIQAKQIIYTDGDLDKRYFTHQFALTLKQLAPWGQAFPEPCFEGEFNIIEQRLVAGKHLQLTLSKADLRQPLRAIAFNIDPSNWPNHRAKKIYAVFQLDQNEYKDLVQLQLLISYLSVTKAD